MERKQAVTGSLSYKMISDVNGLYYQNSSYKVITRSFDKNRLQMDSWHRSLLEHDDASDERSPEGCSQCSRKAHQMHQSNDSRHPHSSLLAFLFLHYFSQLHRVQNQPCCRTRHHHSQICKPPHHSTKPNQKSPTHFSEVLLTYPSKTTSPLPFNLHYLLSSKCMCNPQDSNGQFCSRFEGQMWSTKNGFLHTHKPISSTHFSLTREQISLKHVAQKWQWPILLKVWSKNLCHQESFFSIHTCNPTSPQRHMHSTNYKCGAKTKSALERKGKFSFSPKNPFSSKAETRLTCSGESSLELYAQSAKFKQTT